MNKLLKFFSRKPAKGAVSDLCDGVGNVLPSLVDHINGCDGLASDTFCRIAVYVWPDGVASFEQITRVRGSTCRRESWLLH